LTPSFNPGTPQPKEYPSGYSYEPPAVKAGEPLPPNPKPVDVWQAIHPPSAVDAYNARYREMLAGTVWQYYKMVNVQNEYVSGSPAKPDQYWVPMTGNPNTGTTRVYLNSNDMSNVTMETYLQANNCIACHAYGRPKGISAGSPKDLGTTQIFTFLLNAAKSPTASAMALHRPIGTRQAHGAGAPKAVARVPGRSSA
jgi:hypothetical protein